MQFCLVVIKYLVGLPANGRTVVMFSSPSIMSMVKFASTSLPLNLPLKYNVLTLVSVTALKRVPATVWSTTFGSSPLGGSIYFLPPRKSAVDSKIVPEWILLFLCA